MSSKIPFSLKTGLFCTLFFVSTHHSAFADVMGNLQYKLDTSGSNYTSQPNTTSQGNNNNTNESQQNISNTPQSISSHGSLTFNTSSLAINYGDIMPGEPILRTLHIAINSDQTAYSLLITEDHQLTGNNSSIPDTTCDSGMCSTKVASSWQSPLTFGFGFRCSDTNSACNSDFSNQNFYKPVSKPPHPPEQVLSSIANTTNADVIFKVNISGAQTQTNYQNTINLILLPKI